VVSLSVTSTRCASTARLAPAPTADESSKRCVLLYLTLGIKKKSRKKNFLLDQYKSTKADAKDFFFFLKFFLKKSPACAARRQPNLEMLAVVYKGVPALRFDGAINSGVRVADSIEGLVRERRLPTHAFSLEIQMTIADATAAGRHVRALAAAAQDTAGFVSDAAQAYSKVFVCAHSCLCLCRESCVALYMCPDAYTRPHTHTHTRTHTTRARALSLSLSRARSLSLALSLSHTQKGWALLYETNSAEESVTIRFLVSLAANNDVNNRGRMASVSHTLAAAHVQDTWTHLVAVCK
jgi:hypothetical protein